jgi:hypothetical protein
MIATSDEMKQSPCGVARWMVGRGRGSARRRRAGARARGRISRGVAISVGGGAIPTRFLAGGDQGGSRGV